MIVELPRLPAATALQARLRSATAADAATWTSAAAAAALPLVSPSGPANMTLADLFIAVAVCATAVWAWRASHVWRFPFLVAAALYVSGGAVGALAGPVPGTGLVALVQDAALLLWCWSLANVGSTAARLAAVTRAFAYSAVAWGTVLVAGLATGSSLLTGLTSRDGARATLTFQDPNYAGNYFFVALMLVWAVGRPRRLPARLAATAVLLVSLVATGSNSALVSLLTGVVVAGLLALYRLRGIAPAFAALVGVVAVGYAAHTLVSLNAIEQRAQDSNIAVIRDGLGRGASSVAERSTILHESLQLFRGGSILGTGPVSTKTRLAREQAPYVKEAHDDYVATLLERGLIGSLGLVLLVAGVLQRSAIAATRPLARGYALVVPRPTLLAGAVAGALVGGAFNELLHTRQVWTLFGLVAALCIWGAGGRARS
jgi:hypothetical protein